MLISCAVHAESSNMKKLKFIVLFAVLLSFGACTETQFSERFPSQPLEPEPQFNRFSQEFDQGAQEKIVDLLVVVDNSVSMLPDQEKLSIEFANFVNAISDADYRIGVITTDTNSVGNEDRPGFHGNLDIVESTGRRYISRQDSNPEQLFADLTKRKETVFCEENRRRPEFCPSFDERPLLAIKQAIDKRNTSNLGFFRPGADLGVIIITDEDEIENEDGSYYSAEDLLEHFSNEFTDSKKMTSFSISILEEDSSCLEIQRKDVKRDTSVRYGLRVGELSNLTGGFNSSICDENYGAAIQSVSRYVERNLIPIIVDVPDSIILESVELIIIQPDGSPFEADFTLEDKKLRILPSPPRGSKVTLRYNYRP